MMEYIHTHYVLRYYNNNSNTANITHEISATQIMVVHSESTSDKNCLPDYHLFFSLVWNECLDEF